MSALTTTLKKSKLHAEYIAYVENAISRGLIVDHGEHAVHRYSLMTFDDWVEAGGPFYNVEPYKGGE